MVNQMAHGNPEYEIWQCGVSASADGITLWINKSSYLLTYLTYLLFLLSFYVAVVLTAGENCDISIRLSSRTSYANVSAYASFFMAFKTWAISYPLPQVKMARDFQISF